ncbi:GntP family permease [Paracoccus sp. DMF-8]|uniref:GntP family permease n=1 Tax=Paracoccus sp. DMF-8 TaxID=3019445 RepID=UPI0023E38409|nr:GntP family permease [Paracoccus sp. DMF-8]MDF3608034.1 GntP family permease [Paracoccus sp. DMF-8]
MGLSGILIALAFLMFMAFRGWSILLLAPVAALMAAALSAEPLLANWTQIFMPSAAGFIAQFFPLFLLGALFGKLMDDSGSVRAIARLMTRRLGPRRAILAVVLAGALVTYGGVSLFVAFFVIAPMGLALFRAGEVPRRLLPAALALGTSTFTMSALPGTPAIQNAIPMPFFGTDPFAAPGLGIIASVVMFTIGMGWLTHAHRRAHDGDEGFEGCIRRDPVQQGKLRGLASTASDFDPAEIDRGSRSGDTPPVWVALVPLGVVLAANLILSQFLLPRMDTAWLAAPRWGGVQLSDVAGVWSVAVALALAIVVLTLLNRRRLTGLRLTVEAGANASVLPVMSVASLVGFGAVIATLPAFDLVRDWVLGTPGGPLVSLAVATNILAALTGSASGGMSIALESLGPTYLQIARDAGIDPGLMHRVAVMSSGTLDTLPHNGAVVTMLAVSGCNHRKSYLDIVMVAIVSALAALVVVIALGSVFGSF